MTDSELDGLHEAIALHLIDGPKLKLT